MKPLNFPEYPFYIQGVAEEQTIYDPIRRKYVRLTPEEWVRQHLIQYLVAECGFPVGLIAVERVYPYQGFARRADIVVYDRKGRPAVLAECKSPEVAVTQAVFDQAARYNSVVGAPYLVVTNGLVHYCCRIDRQKGTVEFLDGVPHFDHL